MSDKYSSLDHETLRTMIRGKDRRIRELEQRLAAVEVLPRYTHTTFCGAVPDSTGRWIKRDDLLAALQSAAASESNQTTNLMR